jgi:hypothetical protein
MTKRRNLDKEGLKVYPLNLLLAYHPIIQICGILFLAFSALAFTLSPAVGGITLVLALILMSMTSSYNAVVYTAKFEAWLGSLSWDKD